jgi:hypothetical protein
MADLPKAAPSAANPRVLAVYGVPPDMPLQDAAAKSIGKTFSLTTVNRASFESALKQGLSGFVGGDAPLASARFVFIRGLPDLSAAVRSGEWKGKRSYSWSRSTNLSDSACWAVSRVCSDSCGHIGLPKSEYCGGIVGDASHTPSWRPGSKAAGQHRSRSQDTPRDQV